MSPLITSQNMDDAYIIDDRHFWGAQQRHAAQDRLAQGEEQLASKQTGTQSGTDTEVEGPYQFLKHNSLCREALGFHRSFSLSPFSRPRHPIIQPMGGRFSSF